MRCRSASLASSTGSGGSIDYTAVATGAFGLETWVDGGGLGITIRNEPRETVLTSIAISGGGVGNAAPYVKFGPKF